MTDTPRIARWIDAVNTRDKATVLAIYAPEDAVLLGTFSSGSRAGLGAVGGYFDGFLALDGLTAELGEVHASGGDDWAVESGTYTFTHHDGGTEQVVEARYTMAWRRVRDQWWLVQHHSSVVPGDLG